MQKLYKIKFSDFIKFYWTQPYLFTYCLWLLFLQWQNQVVTKVTLGVKSIKYLVSDFLQIMFAGPWTGEWLNSRYELDGDANTNIEELMFLNCGAGEDSWKSPGLQEDQTSQS